MGKFSAWLEKWFGVSAGETSRPEGSGAISQPASEKHKKFKVDRIQPTPNPDAFQFIMNQKVIHSGKKIFDSPDEAKGDPLAEALFAVFGIENVYLQENFVTVTKSQVVGWDTVLEKINEALEKHLTFYETPDAPEEMKTPAGSVLEAFKKEDFPNMTDEQKSQIVEAVLDEAIRPALANDGGGLEVIGMEGDVVIVRYEGACGSCPSSTTGTLHYIESFLKETVSPDLQVHAS